MAAMSLSDRANALWPIFSGGALFEKWTPSTTASVLNNTQRSGNPRSITAQSSPAPTTVLEFPGSVRVRRAINSNSFIVNRSASRFIPLAKENQDAHGSSPRGQSGKSNYHPVPGQIFHHREQEVGEIEQAVREYRRHQIVGRVVQPGQHH